MRGAELKRFLGTAKALSERGIALSAAVAVARRSECDQRARLDAASQNISAKVILTLSMLDERR